ncbi:MAG: hypothetical protein C0407_01095 [Desulfobacca sp.]|nr:hypothetical protein [Desulfobacca sp.]
MSYILDALKKFEQKREHNDPTKSLTFLGAQVPEPKRRPWWPYPIIAALLLNAGIMIWLIGPWRSEQKETSPKPSTVEQPRPMVPKGNEQKGVIGIGTLKEVRPPQDRALSPKPPAGKDLPGDANSAAGAPRDGAGAPRDGAGAPRDGGQISGKAPASDKAAPRSVPNQPISSQTKSIPNKNEGQQGKKVIYFKDGKSESCDEIEVTENFIHCTKKGGGSIINLNKIDLEKTLSGKPHGKTFGTQVE